MDDLEKLEFSISAYQSSIVHKAFCLSTSHISSTNRNCSQDKKMRTFSDDAFLVVTYEFPSVKGHLFQNKRFYEALKKEGRSGINNVFIA